MTYEEAIEAIKLEGFTIEATLARMASFSQGIKKAQEALEKAEKYRWHNLRENPNDLPQTSGLSYVPCMILREYSSIPEYAEYEFFEGYGWGFFGVDFESIIAWKEIEPFEEGEV